MALQPVHINISQEIQDWLKAVKGKQVRASNASALTKLQDQMNGAVDYLVEKGTTVDNTVTEVQTVKNEAQAAVDHANSITDQYKQYADDKLAATEAQRQLAETAKQGADNAAILAESWAIGGTGTRPGEGGNNSKAYCDQAHTHAQNAKNEADRASMYANFVTPDFVLENNRLYINDNSTVDFTVADNKLYFRLPA